MRHLTHSLLRRSVLDGDLASLRALADPWSLKGSRIAFSHASPVRFGSSGRGLTGGSRRVPSCLADRSYTWSFAQASCRPTDSGSWSPFLRRLLKDPFPPLFLYSCLSPLAQSPRGTWSNFGAKSLRSAKVIDFTKPLARTQLRGLRKSAPFRRQEMKRLKSGMR